MAIKERPTTETKQIGSYFIYSYNLTGIKEAGTTKIIGDVTFTSQDKISITFNQITDPEMLSTAVRRLKNKRIIDRIDNKYQINDLTSNKQEGIVCSKCQRNNSPDSNFCNKCGNSLTTSCKKCGHSNISESLFCSKCGTEI